MSSWRTCSRSNAPSSATASSPALSHGSAHPLALAGTSVARDLALLLLAPAALEFAAPQRSFLFLVVVPQVSCIRHAATAGRGHRPGAISLLPDLSWQLPDEPASSLSVSYRSSSRSVAAARSRMYMQLRHRTAGPRCNSRRHRTLWRHSARGRTRRQDRPREERRRRKTSSLACVQPSCSLAATCRTAPGGRAEADLQGGNVPPDVLAAAHNLTPRNSAVKLILMRWRWPLCRRLC